MRRAAPLLLLALAGCGTPEGEIVWNSAVDELRGPPSEVALRQSARFVGGGLSFDYPAVLRLRPDFDPDGDRSWKLEYGMFTLEVRALRSPLSADDLLGTFESTFAGGDSFHAEARSSGEPIMLCGQPRTPVTLRLRMMGDWSRMTAIDLPAPEGESRMLVFDDELVAGEPSALGQATFDRVTRSLACTAS